MAKWLDKLMGPTEIPEEGPKGHERTSEKIGALPKLQLKLEGQSEPIFLKPEAQSVLPFGEYSLVQLGDRVIVIDSKGHQVRDFEPKSSTKLKVEWKELATSKNKHGKLSNHYIDGTELIIDSDVPSSLRDDAYALLGKKNNEMEIFYSTETQSKPGGKLRVSKNGRYIFISSDGEVFVSYDTQKNGEAVPPRLWEVKGHFLPRHAPKDMKDDLEALRKGESEKAHCTFLGDYQVYAHENEVIFKKAWSEVHKEGVQGVGTNVAVDPEKPSVIHFCRTNNPTEILTLDTEADPKTWKSTSKGFPQGIHFESIRDLKLDPTGYFFHCTVGDKLVILDRETLEPIEGDMPLKHAALGNDGKVRGINSKGQLVVCTLNLDEIHQSIDLKKTALLAQGIDMGTLFGQPGTSTKATVASVDKGLAALDPLRKQYEPEFRKRIDHANSEDDLKLIVAARDVLKNLLLQQNLSDEQAGYVIAGITAMIDARKAAIAEKTVDEILTDVRKQIAAGVTIRIIGQIGDKLTQAENLQNVVSKGTREQVSTVTAEFQQKSQELFTVTGDEIKREVDGFVETARVELEKMDRHAQFDQWRDFELPKLKRMLSETAKNCPPVCADARKHITDARHRLQQLADTHEKRFREQYDAIRQKAATQIQQIVETLEHDIHSLIERMGQRSFASRDEAQSFIETSPVYTELVEEIRLLADRNSDASNDLHRTLQVSVANFLYEVDRKKSVVNAADGRQVEMFGSVAFPIFEAPVAKKQEKKADLVFQAEEKSKGPGVSANDIMGDIAMRITTSHGKEQLVRLWEGVGNEDDWRYGAHMQRGQAVHPSYLSQEDFRAIKKNFQDWQKEKGGLKGLYETEREKLRAHSKTRKPPAQRGPEDAAWQQEHKNLLEGFASFCSKHHIPLLRRLEQIQNADEPEYANGSGLVPGWNNHWVIAPEDEKILEKMATFLKMQLDLQEGMLNLKGHAGTGKDVYIKLFAHRTNRPYFSFDCSRWTNETDLSADIILEAENGATKTVELPSVVVIAIQTPGAILYFNEWNAMPETAQIFLNALLDEKRSMSLKTRSGQVIKAHPSVLIASSMNPNYPGTNKLSAATRRRISDIEIGYPSLTREPSKGDTNPNKPFSVSEPLKIARSVSSLTDATTDREMERNDFVQWWDYQINGIGTPPNLTVVQKFDIAVIQALVQYSAKLREAFMVYKSTTKTPPTNALPVETPITLSEMRRCGYLLGNIPPEEKAVADAEETARNLIKTTFTPHIDEPDDREKVETALELMSIQKQRLAA